MLADFSATCRAVPALIREIPLCWNSSWLATPIPIASKWLDTNHSSWFTVHWGLLAGSDEVSLVLRGVPPIVDAPTIHKRHFR
ncbi:hypothetical protein [Amycolatopsis regifaucium]|uniref:Uncharacterized protein n=1 Tax=Amycolatopsis regifaucium TaxID=546365 RepID=A0A154M5A4_9PSEU|nr:hypothetical protein [Amycolatopsis regifaucium]KZB79683.1 hypothetical protein AVL48_14855 [Amycolatopsis regifaucium]OKA10001.1 hypothetical protein ATP06_0206560 [Amycolatopsis regifaucium]SFI65581.1 hypothetical protein SAMN04489731_11275 [Amycolatopsis regifaucium]